MANRPAALRILGAPGIAGGAVFVLTFLFRLLYLHVTPTDTHITPLHVDKWGDIAEALVGGHGFGTFAADGSFLPTAFRLPLYPLVLAGLFKLSGSSDTVALWTQCLWVALTAFLVFRLGHGMTGRVRAGLFAAGLVVFYQPEWWMVLRLWSEPFYTALLVLVLLNAREALRDPSRGRFLRLGLWGGLLGLTRPVGTLLFLSVLAGVWWTLRRPPLRIGAGISALALGVFMLVLSPWVIRNAVQYQAFVPFDTTGGYNLYVGTLGYRTYVPYQEMDPGLVAQVEGAPGPVADRVFRRAAVERIQADPLAHVVRSVKKGIIFLFPLQNPETDWMPRPRSLLVNGLLLILALAGWRRLPSRARPFAGLLWTVLIVDVLIHTQIHAQPRMFYPMVPVLALLAAGVTGGGRNPKPDPAPVP